MGIIFHVLTQINQPVHEKKETLPTSYQSNPLTLIFFFFFFFCKSLISRSFLFRLYSATALGYRCFPYYFPIVFGHYFFSQFNVLFYFKLLFSIRVWALVLCPLCLLIVRILFVLFPNDQCRTHSCIVSHINIPFWYLKDNRDFFQTLTKIFNFQIFFCFVLKLLSLQSCPFSCLDFPLYRMILNVRKLNIKKLERKQAGKKQKNL